MPRSTTSQPASARSAASIVLLLSRICPGCNGEPSSTSSSPVDSTATRARGHTVTEPDVDARQHGIDCRCDRRAGAEEHVADTHVVAGPANRGAGGHRPGQADAVVADALGVLDHHHGVGARAESAHRS
jgi:hypothetical protein